MIEIRTTAMEEIQFKRRLFVAVHAGAGFHSQDNSQEYKNLCKKACLQAMSVLHKKKSATEAVTAAVSTLEDAELSNAGRGSNLTLSGSVECDASVMDGAASLFGAVGCLPGVLNPVQVAHRLLETQQRCCLSLGRVTPSVLVGEGARDWARQQGFPCDDTHKLITGNSSRLFRKYKRKVERAEKQQCAKKARFVENSTGNSSSAYRDSSRSPMTAPSLHGSTLNAQASVDTCSVQASVDTPNVPTAPGTLTAELEAAPKGDHPRCDSREKNMSRGTTADRNMPRDTTADRNMPWDTTADRNMPRDTTADRNIPWDATADRNMPQDTTADRNMPQDTTTDRNMPQITTADRNMPQNVTADRNMSRGTTADRNMPRDTTADRNMPWDTTADRNMPRDTTADRNIPWDATADRNMPQDTTADRNMPQDTTTDRNMPQITTADRNMPRNVTADRNMPRDTTADRNIPWDTTADRNNGDALTQFPSLSKASSSGLSEQNILDSDDACGGLAENQVQDTVGALCIDWEGHISAAVSSGGNWLKTPGRLGPAAMYGAACWAQDVGEGLPGVAVIASGCGEHLMRTLLAKTCADCLLSAGDVTQGLSTCFSKHFLGSRLLSGVERRLAGIVAILATQTEDGVPDVDVCWGHTTESMAVGYMRGDSCRPKTLISRLSEGCSPGQAFTMSGAFFSHP